MSAPNHVASPLPKCCGAPPTYSHQKPFGPHTTGVFHFECLGCGRKVTSWGSKRAAEKDWIFKVTGVRAVDQVSASGGGS